MMTKKKANLMQEASMDPASILAAETAKKPCRRFQQTGFCDYGDGCRFSHMTDEKRRELEEQCRQSQQQKRHQTSSSAAVSDQPSSVVLGDVDEWLAKRAKRQESADAGGRKGGRRTLLPRYCLPAHLAAASPDLPPSLLPPTKDDFVGLPLLEWG
ncbi:zinc finger matrin-type protein 5-like isoform X2 [Babylonia areolata]|uniref:zinc finger matrin-type protein 5-like isoform X2 n=1 Tax=Babylonia areolata TaxID=304850 RepID=UPI003FD2116F